MLETVTHSVRHKVVALVLTTTLVALLVSTATLLWYELRTLRQFLLDDARTQAEIIARSSAPALQFDDPEEAVENLALLSNRRQILAAAIYAADGSEFARYQRDANTDLPKRSPSPSEEIGDDGTLELFHPVYDNGILLGTVYLRSATDLGKRIRDFATILMAVMLVSLGVAAVLSTYLQRGVTAPILAVTSIAKRIIDGRDFALRAQKTTDDEVGVLVLAFNAMLDEVEATTGELQAANRQLLSETEERRQAEAALRLADERKDEFLAVLAHELRNPLAPMRTAVHLLHGTTLDGTAARARSILGRQIEHMVRLVEDLLDVSRITRGTLALSLDTVDIGDALSNAVETARSYINDRGHTLELALSSRPMYVRGDAVRLAQVFANVINNAAKYTEPEGHIRVSADISDACVVVRVRDNGIGMSPETLARAFDMFTQGSTEAGKRRQAGLGVGLGIARRLIDLHGGTLSASSAGVGRGSEFVITLNAVMEPAPATNRADHGAPSGASAAHHSPRSDHAPRAKRILLVDDNVDFVTSMALLLEAHGHRVRIAHDGPSALDTAREHRPDISFLDIGLPDMTGHELAIQLHAFPETANTVLVAVSGWGQEQDRARSRAAGFAEHLTKPVDVARILATIAALDAPG